ncbi:MAG: S1 RNA-binding domain-containing protein, partial [Clostridia bacterium]|nr:S1 RNA-binding domain-containing protein [Clostridia bacterium]
MALGVGEIVEGKVTGLTKFGAFVSLPEEKVGMIHISEVSTTYVKDIGEFLEKGQTVKVKVLNIDENGKISLSLKQVPENAEVVRKAEDDHRDNGERRERKLSAPNVWQGQKSKYSDKQD